MPGPPVALYPLLHPPRWVYPVPNPKAWPLQDRPQPLSPLGGGGACAVPTLCKKYATSDPFSLMAKVTVVSTEFPCTGLPRFLLSPKTQMMSQTNRCFTLKMPDCCLNLLFLPRGHMLPRWWGGLQGGHGNANLLLGAVTALYRNAPWVLTNGWRVGHTANGPGHPFGLQLRSTCPCPAVCPMADVIIVLYANESHSEVPTDQYLSMLQPHSDLHQMIEVVDRCQVPMTLSTQALDLELLASASPHLLQTIRESPYWQLIAGLYSHCLPSFHPEHLDKQLSMGQSAFSGGCTSVGVPVREKGSGCACRRPNSVCREFAAASRSCETKCECQTCATRAVHHAIALLQCHCLLFQACSPSLTCSWAQYRR